MATMVVTDVMMERLIQAVMLLSMTYSCLRLLVLRPSRIRSKMTIVSLME